MTECKNRGKYGKGLFVGTEESEDYQEEETEEFVVEPTFDIVVALNLLKNMVIADQC